MYVDAAPDLLVDGSAAALREAFTNLVFNALDAMPHGGTISLVASARGGRVCVDMRTPA